VAAEEPAAVVELVHLRRVGVDARGPVHDDRVPLPALLPEVRRDLQELVGALVALVVRGHVVHAVCLRGGLLAGRDDVPADSAAGEVIEAVELAREPEGVDERGRDGGDDPDVLRRIREPGREGQRVEPRHRIVERREGDVVLEHDVVEAAALERLHHVDVELAGLPVLRLVVRADPRAPGGGPGVRHRIGEPGEMEHGVSF
jgi:hypothetical protein